VDGLIPGTTVTGRGTRLPMLAGYAGTVRSHVGAIIVLAIFGGLVGGYLAHRVPPSFKSSASIELPDVPTYVDTDPEPPAPGRTTIDTTAQLVFSEPVYEAVEAATQLPEDKVRDGLSVSAYPLSRVLIVTFTARSQDTAIAGAQAASQALVAEREVTLPGAQLDRAIELRQELDALRDRSREVRAFSPQTQVLTFQLLQIEQALQAGADAGGRIVDEADTARAVNAHPELQLVSGLLGGLLAGIGYSWWRRDKHLHHDPRLIGLAAKVRPRRRSEPRSPQPARGPRTDPTHSHGH
jgi:hypothetical protein